jgi:hypothetical protein
MTDSLNPTEFVVPELESESLRKRVRAVGSMFLFWCALRAIAGLVLLFMAPEREAPNYQLVAWFFVLLFGGCSVLGWLVKTRASIVAARLLFLLPVALVWHSVIVVTLPGWRRIAILISAAHLAVLIPVSIACLMIISKDSL